MLKRLLGVGTPLEMEMQTPERDYIPPVGQASITHNMVYDDKTILAIVAALLYMPNQTASQTVDKAAELLREVNAR